jgi:hypothetical protein
MKLKLVKASQGVVWVRQGLLACRQQPLGYIGLLGLFATASLVMVVALDELGAILLLSAAPVAWMGFMLATRRVLTGERITPDVLIEAVRRPDTPRRHFALLGAAYVVAFLIARTLAQWLGPDPEALDQLIKNSKDTAELMSEPLMQQSLLTSMLLVLPVSLLFWHTPALVLWTRATVGKALFFSAIATWRNIGAFAVYGLCWGGLFLAVASVASFIAVLLPVPLLANALVMAAIMWVVAAFYASLYFTVVDCFEPHRPEDAGPSVDTTV